MTSPRLPRNKPAIASLAFALLLSGCGATTPSRPTEAQPAATPVATSPSVALDSNILSDYMMATNSYKGGNLQVAETIFLKMAAANPELPGPHANLGMIYSAKGEFDKAEAEFNQALTLKPDLPEVYNQLGILHRNKGQFEQARQNYQAGLKLAPNNPNLLINLGILYDLYLNQPQEALTLWQHYKTIVSEDKQVDIWIADINQRAASQ